MPYSSKLVSRIVTRLVDRRFKVFRLNLSVTPQYKADFDGDEMNMGFEHNYQVDVTYPVGGFLAGVLQVGLDDCSLELQVIDRRKPCDLEPGYIIDSVKEFTRRPVIMQNNYLSAEAQDNATWNSECIYEYARAKSCIEEVPPQLQGIWVGSCRSRGQVQPVCA
jgi:hypothetical protein